LLVMVLPFESSTIEDVLQLVAGRQQRNHRAWLSPRSRRMPVVPG
jgi:hypothetical protein